MHVMHEKQYFIGPLAIACMNMQHVKLSNCYVLGLMLYFGIGFYFEK